MKSKTKTNVILSFNNNFKKQVENKRPRSIVMAHSQLMAEMVTSSRWEANASNTVSKNEPKRTVKKEKPKENYDNKNEKWTETKTEMSLKSDQHFFLLPLKHELVAVRLE